MVWVVVSAEATAEATAAEARAGATAAAERAAGVTVVGKAAVAKAVVATAGGPKPPRRQSIKRSRMTCQGGGIGVSTRGDGAR